MSTTCAGSLSTNGPDPVTRALGHINPSIYVPMQGPSELGMSGTLEDWDRSEDLRDIDVGLAPRQHPARPHLSRTRHAPPLQLHRRRPHLDGATSPHPAPSGMSGRSR